MHLSSEIALDTVKTVPILQPNMNYKAKHADGDILKLKINPALIVKILPLTPTAEFCANLLDKALRYFLTLGP